MGVDGRRTAATVKRFLSLGAGVQSTTLALLTSDGILPRVDAAIFADTGWEPQEVYDHLDHLERYMMEKAGIPVIRAGRGRLQDDVLDRRKFATLPAWTKKADGSRGRILRQCTPKYKVEPIERVLRELLGAKVWTEPCRYCGASGQRVAPWDRDAGEGTCSVCGGTGIRNRVGSVPAGTEAEQWIGFSVDEWERATSVGFPKWAKPRHPLLELGWTRNDCIRWMADRGWSGVRKSACLGCPFHDDETWLEMADTEPTVFAELVEFDAAYRNHSPALEAEVFLHEARLPLDQAVAQYRALKEAQGEQLVMWDEFKAKRRIRSCNPFGCRSVEMDDPVPVMIGRSA